MLRRQRASAADRGPRRQPRRDHARHQQAAGQHGRGGRGDDRDHRDRGRRQDRGHRDGQHRAHQHVGQFVDIGTQPRRQIAAVPAASRRRRARAPAGCRAARARCPRRAARCRGRPAVRSSQHAAGDAERAHRHDRDRQVQHRRHLPGPGDQPGGHRGQRQRTAERQHPADDASSQPRQPRAQQGQRTRSRGSPTRARGPPPIDDASPTASTGVAVPDDEDGRRRRRPAPTMARSTRASVAGVEMCGGLVEQQHRRGGAEHAGQPEPLPLAQRQADPAAADDGLQPVGQARRAPSSKHAARQALSRSGSGPNSSRFSRTVPGISTGRCASQATSTTSACGSRSVTSTPSTRTRPDAAGQAEDRLQQRGLADAVRAGEDRDPAGSHGVSRPGVDRRGGRRELVRTDRRGRPTAAAGRLRSSIEREAPLSAAVFPSCAAWNSAPTRRSGQNTSGASSSAVSASASVISPNTRRRPDADRDQRDAERGKQFEHQRGQERDAQRRHRRTAMGRTEFGDPGRRAVGAAQRAQRRDARDEVEQPGLQRGHRGQRRRRPVRGGQADQHHEERDQRQRDQHDQRRPAGRTARSRPRRPGSGSRRGTATGRYAVK